MKRNTLIIAALFVAGTVMSQDLTSKKGELYLPEAGEYAIGIDASPFLNYFGNFIGGNGFNTAPVFTPHGSEVMSNGFAIYGKQFVDANTAYRAKVRIGFNSMKDRYLVEEVDGDGPTGDMVEQDTKNSDFGIALGAGLEKRRGNTRLQGVYGGEAWIGFGSAKTTNTYANDLDDVPFEAGRITEDKQGSELMFGLNGFVGVEYFFAPKMSVAGEYTWGLNLTSMGDGEVTVETFDSDGDVTTETFTDAGESSFGIDTGIVGAASLRLMFHF